MRQHDAHVRARLRLIRRVRDRMDEWGSPGRRRGESIEDLMARRDKMAAQRLAAHKWCDGWWIKWGPYSPYSGCENLGMLKDVPEHEIHSIMCNPYPKDHP